MPLPKTGIIVLAAATGFAAAACNDSGDGKADQPVVTTDTATVTDDVYGGVQATGEANVDAHSKPEGDPAVPRR